MRDGTRALSAALAQAAKAYGAEVRTDAGVAQILLEDGRASGVLLENGERLEARCILSSATPRHIFFDLVGAPNLEVSFGRELNYLVYRGCTARLNLTLDGLPAFRSLPAAEQAQELIGGHILVCPSLDYLEHAYDDAKYGEISHQPMLDAVIPTLLDDSLAPPGKHILSVNVRYAPLSSGRVELGDPERTTGGHSSCVPWKSTLPGIRGLVLNQGGLTPLDLERGARVTDGCIFHGRWRSTSSGSCVPFPHRPPTTPRSRTCSCAGQAPTPGVALPAPQAATWQRRC